MGLINDFKKLLFGAKAVGKSAAEKTTEKVRETGGDIKEKAEDFAEDIGEKVIETGSKIFDTAKDVARDITEKIFDDAKSDVEREDAEQAQKAAQREKDNKGYSSVLIDKDKAKQEAAAEASSSKGTDKTSELLEKAEEIGEKIKKAADPYVDKAEAFAEKVGKEVLDKGGKAAEQAGKIAEDVGEKVLDTGKKVLDRFQESAEEIGGKIWEKGKELYDKAQEEAAKEGRTHQESDDDIFEEAKKQAAGQSTSFDELVEKAKQAGEDLEDKVASKPKHKLEDSTLEGKDDFFARAQRFAEGDYHGTGKPKLKISKEEEEPKKKPNTGIIKGFDDHDGDGDSLIDDAIIDEEE